MKPNPFFFALYRIFIFTCTRVNRETTTKRNAQYIIHNRADLRTNQTRERDPIFFLSCLCSRTRETERSAPQRDTY
ncbi:hypothetical protein NXS19_007893 [Fusarium pseudograminearum]|nr:hypothetical protein NXS19_007893 [Fusarium pseudograminearum]